MLIRPFAALRPQPDKASAIASLPYDVMDSEEAREMAAGNPLSFLHVVRSEIDLPPEADCHSAAVYEKARDNLRALVDSGALLREAEPAIYLYRQTMGTHEQTAVVACCSIDDYAEGRILRHEKTRRDKEDDRTSHILTTRAHTGQIFLCYRDEAAIDALVEAECKAEPLYDFLSSDGIRHTVWKAANPEALQKAFEAVPKAYIADGHHRAAASYRAGMEARRAGAAPGSESDYTMACLFPASQLSILPYNRVVADRAGLTTAELVARIEKEGFMAEQSPCAVKPEQPGIFGMFAEGRWWKLSLGEALAAEVAAGDAVERLDASVLQERVLSPILGIGDVREDPRISFVGGIRGTGELEERAGADGVAFSLHATGIDQLLDVADAGLLMPPKSTWFEPKLRSGLFIHRISK